MKYQLLILCFLFALSSNAQDWDIPRIAKSNWNTETPQSVDKKKRNILLISEATAYTVALVGLNKMWYSNYPKSKFHFINDNGEWLQMDKLGHMTASYYTGVAGIKAYQWTGMSRKNAIWYGGLTGTFFLTIIEALDGQSAEWGASSGDLIANSVGSFLAIGQELIWNEQRVQLKYSYKPSIWANQNPEQLGENHLQRALKDYNGQTYWLSFNLKSFMQIESDDFPNWLCLSLGYGAHFMRDPYPMEGKPVWRKRQYFVSFDLDLNRLKTNNKVLNTIIHTFGFLKFPAPAIQFRNGKIFFHSIYY
jgi:hypothetical protein